MIPWIATMREILSDLDHWQEQHEKIALATVVQTWGSSPRGVGSKMALTPHGRITGSVSGGCVEAAVVQAGLETLRGGRAQLLHFGVADETAWQVGLACGGQIDVFVQSLDDEFYRTTRAELLAGRSFAVSTVIRGPDQLMGKAIVLTKALQARGSISPELDAAVIESARSILKSGHSQSTKMQIHQDETIEVFTEVVDPQPTLIVVGGVHIAIALTGMAKSLGFRTVVVDPRRAFVTPERFPHVDQLIQAWPDEAFQQISFNEKTAVAILTHDPKIDDPALKIVLQNPAFYVGALGSPTTQAKRRQRLLQDGVSETQLERLHGPIGLKLGSQTPEEIALSILAEITAVQHGVIS